MTFANSVFTFFNTHITCKNKVIICITCANKYITYSFRYITCKNRSIN